MLYFYTETDAETPFLYLIIWKVCLTFLILRETQQINFKYLFDQSHL